MQGRRRCLAFAAAQTQRAAATISLQEPAASLQSQPFTVLRLPSSAAQACSSGRPANEALPSQQRHLWQHERRQRRRRLSHYAASTSRSPAVSGAAGGSHRPFSSTASGSSPAERGFASQPAFAYATAEDAEPQQAALPAEPTLLELAHTAAATLKARAVSRLEEARAVGQAPAFTMPQRAPRRPAEEQILKLVPKVEDMAPELPVWERLCWLSSGHAGAEDASSAALHTYRQEVLHGQDPEAHGLSGAPGGFPHVPFLRSGLTAAQQGYCLQSELSRLSMRSRLQPPAGEARPYSRGQMEGLKMVMAASRAGGDMSQANLLEAAVAGGLFTLGRGGDDAYAGKVAAAVAAAAGGGHLSHHDPDGEEAHALAELLGWEEQQQAADAAAQRTQRAQQQQPPPRRWQQVAALQPHPSASSCDVMLALGSLDGVRRHSIEDAVLSLYGESYRRRAIRDTPLEVLTPSADPAECLGTMRKMAEVLVQDLGEHAFVALINKAPWVLLLNPERHGRPQLGCLHITDMSQQERGELLLAYPRLLMADAEGHMLPLFEYLQGLGMTTEQMAHVMQLCPHFCLSSTLPALKSLVSFWLGRGMSREDLVKMVANTPEVVYCSIPDSELAFDWLADHTGLAVSDVAAVSFFITRSLTSVLGPRIAFTMSKGYKVVPPSKKQHRLPGRHPQRQARQNQMSIRRLTNLGLATLVTRLDATVEEYEAFSAEWVRTDFPAWLEKRRPGIEHYRGMTGSHRRTPTAAAAGAAAAAAAAEHALPAALSSSTAEISTELLCVAVAAAGGAVIAEAAAAAAAPRTRRRRKAPAAAAPEAAAAAPEVAAAVEAAAAPLAAEAGALDGTLSSS